MNLILIRAYLQHFDNCAHLEVEILFNYIGYFIRFLNYDQ